MSEGIFDPDIFDDAIFDAGDRVGPARGRNYAFDAYLREQDDLAAWLLLVGAT
jgi:hypothetical protein